MPVHSVFIPQINMSVSLDNMKGGQSKFEMKRMNWMQRLFQYHYEHLDLKNEMYRCMTVDIKTLGGY